MLCFHNANGIKMATDGLFPLYFAIVIGLLNGAFDNAVLVANPISADGAVHRRCDPAKFRVVNIFSLALDFGQAFFGKIGFNRFKIIVQNFLFFLSKRGSGIAILAASALALVQ